METGVTAVLVYLAVAACCAPRMIRRRYTTLRRRHPHTHPRDVRHDVLHAVAQGTGDALLWFPYTAVWVVLRAAALIGVTVIGRRVVGRHLRAARIAALEEGLR